MEILKASKAKLICSELSSKLNLMGWKMPIDHISFWENESLKIGRMTLRFLMTPHVHHWDSMMIFEAISKSLFTSDIFIQPGVNEPVVSNDLLYQMISLYRATGIFANENLVRRTAKQLGFLT